MNSAVASGSVLEPIANGRRGRRYRLARPLWAAPAVVFLVVFFVLPLLQNAQRSVSEGLAAQDALFYYAKLLSDEYYLGVVWQTLQVSLIVTVVCLLLGYPVAYFMTRHAGRWQGLIVFFLIAPLLTSIIMRTFGWRVLFARRGLVNVWLMDVGIIERPLNVLSQPLSVYIGLVHVLLPFMVLSIAAVLQAIDLRLEESARVLGAGRFRAFTSVTLPLSLDGVATGCILVFMLTNGSFVTMLLLGGNSVVTIPLLIYQQFNLTQDVAFASAMGNLLLVTALACLVVQIRLVRRRGVRAL
jgi:putative spermidine/putrescine transport system permease protein